MLIVALGLGAVMLFNVAGWRLGRLPTFAIIATMVLFPVWLFGLGVEGFMDCWPNCTARQDAARAILFYAPILILIELVIAFVSYVTRETG